MSRDCVLYTQYGCVSPGNRVPEGKDGGRIKNKREETVEKKNQIVIWSQIRDDWA